MKHERRPLEDMRWLLAVSVLLLAVPPCMVAAMFFRLDAQARATYLAPLLAGTAAWGAGVYLMAVRLYSPLARVRKALGDTKADALERARRLRKSGEDPAVRELTRLISTIERQYEQEYQLEMLKKEAELNALQSQINPHFLYNTLDSIRGRLIGEGLREESQIVESLSNLFRYSISPGAVYNTLEQELENVENYMRIIRYRFGDRLTFTREIDHACAYICHCELPKLTLQPIVENAIQHGMEKRAHGGIITVRASVSEAGLNICVEDNGSGMKPETLDRLTGMFQGGAPVQHAAGSGIALVNVNERIRMRYGDGYGLTVYSDEGLGTQVHILLPVRLMPDADTHPEGRAL